MAARSGAWLGAETSSRAVIRGAERDLIPVPPRPAFSGCESLIFDFYGS